MLILACLALGVAACHDDVLAPSRNAPTEPVAQVASGPVAVARYTCVLSRGSSEVRCGLSTPAAPGVSPSVILPPSSPYAQLSPSNMVKDTVAHTWTFTAVVKNHLAQPIGTLDGTTVVGTKVAITEGPTVTGGTGTVTVANADGTGTFTGPDQPYFFYHEVTAPQAFTGEKQWRFNVPNTVTAISISIVISTDFPAEQDVALVPPDSQPAWAHADTAYKDEWLKRVVAVVFKRGTSSDDRQLAVASVGGTVVGGSSLAGMYLLVVPDDGGFVQVDTAVARLNRMPQVGAASRMGRVRGLHLKPHD